ncbi:MAG: polysaccharide biosynthesis/export family protein [Lentisphaerae bacterium]|nr:polysaccharide biosynthesis/export family protein [Lentisphaerota bacterium]
MNLPAFMPALALSGILAMTGCRTADSDARQASVAVDPAQAEMNLLAEQGRQILEGLDGKKNVAVPSPDASGNALLFKVGDRMTLQVWLKDRVSQLSGFPMELVVQESGDLFLPYVGNIHVLNREPRDVQTELQTRFLRMLKEVQVVVLKHGEKTLGTDRQTMVEVGNHLVILGRVARPGLYPMTQGLHLRDALAMAGGFEHYAHPLIYLVRGDAAKPIVKRINMKNIFLGRNLEDNVLMAANDAVYVAPKKMWAVADFITTMLLPVMAVRDSIYVYDRVSGQQ